MGVGKIKQFSGELLNNVLHGYIANHLYGQMPSDYYYICFLFDNTQTISPSKPLIDSKYLVDMNTIGIQIPMTMNQRSELYQDGVGQIIY